MSNIKVTCGDSKVTGVLTCFIRRNLFPDKVYALSCRHVFSLTKKLHPYEPCGCEVWFGGKQIGETLSVKGLLGNGVRYSFDSQLAVINDIDSVKSLKKHGSKYVQYISQITPGMTCRIDKGDGIVYGEVVDFVRESVGIVDYGRPNINKVIHEQLIKVLCIEGDTKSGDSGSPVFIQIDNESLFAGMHIAGAGRYAYFIPAWAILGCNNYSGGGAYDEWSLL